MVDLLIEPVETDALTPGELLSVRLRAHGETGAAEFIIERSVDEAIVASNADGMTALLRRMPMEQPTESELLSADLVSHAHDPVYEAAAARRGGLPRLGPPGGPGRVRRFVVLPTPEAVAEAAADRIVAAARNAIRRRGRFRIALSGRLDAAAGVRAARRAAAGRGGRLVAGRVLLGRRALRPARPPRVQLRRRSRAAARPPPRRASRVPSTACRPTCRIASGRRARYQAQIARAFGTSPDAARPPAFDLVWLGMGRDGHTASLFPGSTALEERRRWVVATWAPGPAVWRMTLTLPIINAARTALFVVIGADKAGPLRSIRSGSDDASGGARSRAIDRLAGRRAGGGDRLRVSSWAWLLGAALAGAGSYLAGWRTWRDSRARQARDLNAERYLAWRGRAERPGRARPDAGRAPAADRGGRPRAGGALLPRRLLHLRVGPMRVELLYWDGDPHYMTARQRLVEVLTEDAFETPIQMIAVNSVADAELLAFPGSPTIRIDGTDIHPAGVGAIRLGLRAYPADDDLDGPLGGAGSGQAADPPRGGAGARLGPRARRLGADQRLRRGSARLRRTMVARA